MTLRDPVAAVAMLQALAFFWGASWGSFLNVVIYRLPMGLSLSRPGSRCCDCAAPIRWFDNIPVLSYVLLRGRCRRCKASFSPCYMLVEAACGVLTLVLFRDLVLPLDPDRFIEALWVWLWAQSFIYALVAITFIDLEHFWIPDEISLPMIAVGVSGALALFGEAGVDRVVGAIGGFVIIWAVIGLGWIMFRREAMGQGDAKLLAVIGAFLGWQALPFVLFASALQGVVAALVAMAWTRVTGRESGLTVTTETLDARFGEADRFNDAGSHIALPYGPFLALAGIEALLFGVGSLDTLAQALAGLLGA